MNFFDHKDLGNHLLQLCPKVVKHPVYKYYIMLEQLNEVFSTVSTNAMFSAVYEHIIL